MDKYVLIVLAIVLCVGAVVSVRYIIKSKRSTEPLQKIKCDNVVLNAQLFLMIAASAVLIYKVLDLYERNHKQRQEIKKYQQEIKKLHERELPNGGQWDATPRPAAHVRDL